MDRKAACTIGANIAQAAFVGPHSDFTTDKKRVIEDSKNYLQNQYEKNAELDIRRRKLRYIENYAQKDDEAATYLDGFRKAEKDNNLEDMEIWYRQIELYLNEHSWINLN